MGFQTQACGMTLGSILGILALLGFLNGEMEMAIGCPRSILWVYEIFVYKVYPAHTWHIVDAPKTEAIILLRD